jgi:hypothetical protein
LSDRADPPAGFLSRQRLIAWSALFLVIETILFIMIVLQQRGIWMPVGPSSIDFVSFYAAGSLALEGHAPLAYNHAAHYAAEQAATAPGVPYVFFYYPPMFLLICAALARLPYLLAYAVFQGVTLTLFIATLRALLRATGWRWFIPVIAFPALFWNIGQGQNAFLTATLLGGFTLLLERRPIAAGALLGALCYKPHLGLLAPVALAASRRWVAFAAATASFLGLALLSLVFFGADTWRAYFVAMSGAEDIYASGRINFAGFSSLFGALRLAGVTPQTAYLLQGAVTLAMAAIIARIWWRRTGPAPAAALLGATLVAVPLVLLYDQVLAVLAVAWLLRDTAGGGLRNWEKLLLIACYPVALMAPILALGTRVPLAILVSAIIAALSIRRAWPGR